MSPIPGMGAFAAQARKKMGVSGPVKGGPPGGNKPDGVHPHASGKPGDIAGGGDQHRDAKQIAAAQVARVRAGKVDQQLVKLMHGYDPNDGYPRWATDEHLWEEAEGAIQPDGDGRNLDDPWLVIAHVYKALGGKINPGAQVGDGQTPPDPGDGDGDEGAGHDGGDAGGNVHVHLHGGGGGF